MLVAVMDARQRHMFDMTANRLGKLQTAGSASQAITITYAFAQRMLNIFCALALANVKIQSLTCFNSLYLLNMCIYTLYIFGFIGPDRDKYLG